MKREITVVIPTHNRRDLLELTLRTVLAQRGVDFDVVIVDDGSTDDVAAGTAQIEHPRVRLVRHTRPLGVTTARNHGAAEATGAWLAFCDDDDLWAPDKLARQLGAAADAGCAWSYGGAVRIDLALRIVSGTPPPPPEEVVRRTPSWNVMPGGSSNVIVRADAFRAAGAWDPGLINVADWDLWARLARDGPPACVAAPLVGYRIHNGNASGNIPLVLREARAIDGRYGAKIDYGELHHYLAWVCLRSGRRQPAVTHFARAAMHGQVRGVGRSVARLVAARAGRRVPALRPSRPVEQAAWLSEAESWIAPLRDRRELGTCA